MASSYRLNKISLLDEPPSRFLLFADVVDLHSRAGQSRGSTTLLYPWRDQWWDHPDVEDVESKKNT